MLVVLIVVAVAAVWGCTAAGLRWAVPCFRIFLEEQDNVVLRHKAEKKMAARMRQDQKVRVGCISVMIGPHVKSVCLCHSV